MIKSTDSLMYIRFSLMGMVRNMKQFKTSCFRPRSNIRLSNDATFLLSVFLKGITGILCKCQV